MKLDRLLEELFPGGHDVSVSDNFVCGTGSCGVHTVAVIGTTGRTAVGVELAHAMAGEVLKVVRRHSGRPILLLVDTQGQRLRRRDEMLGLNSYMAHLAKCLEIARRHGHRIASLVYGEAVSGGYIASGMMADACFALADAQISVMNLPAMARVTKIPLERLEELADSSPVFAPGAENYHRMGQILDLWHDRLAERLAAALDAPAEPDLRRELGLQRGGRKLAAKVAQAVRGDD